MSANLSDFPPEALDSHDTVAVYPDEFLFDQLELHAGQTRQCLRELLDAHQRPAETYEEFCTHLAKTVPRFSARARRANPA